MSPDVIGYQNVVRCHPDNNELPKHVSGLCKTFLLEDINLLDPGLVLLFGWTAIQSVLDIVRDSRWWGSLCKKDNTYYGCLWHPAYVLRRRDLKETWEMSIASIVANYRASINGNYIVRSCNDY